MNIFDRIMTHENHDFYCVFSASQKSLFIEKLMLNDQGTQLLKDFKKCKFEFQINYRNLSSIFEKFFNSLSNHENKHLCQTFSHS
jgi:hypothetical protein